MNFKQVEAFRAIMLSGSMTGAARTLNTSQPNVSRLIAQLEDRIGFTLFLRRSGRLLPTPEAHAFFRDVARAFTGMESLERSADSIRKRGIGRIRIGVVPSMILTLTPRVLRRFSLEFPEASIMVHTSDSVAVGQWVASGYCDIGITSYETGNAGAAVQRIGNMAGVCVVPAGHRLAGGKGPLSPEDLRGETFISLLQGDGTRRRIDAAFAGCGSEPRILTCECQYASAICGMVGLGMGISIVHPAVARSRMDAGIVIREFRPRIPFFTFLVRPVQYPCGRLAERFGELFAQTLRERVPQAAEAAPAEKPRGFGG